MLRFVVPVIISLAAITHAINYQPTYFSAASDAQIKFALENKYDDTGPGAKQPEYAYNTYKTLEEALVGYLDDPDTKLPETERNRALQALVKPSEEYRPDFGDQELKRYYPKTVEEYTGYNQKQLPENQFPRFEIPTLAKHVEVYNGYRLPPQSTFVLTKLRPNPPKKYYQSQREGFLQTDVGEPYRLEKKPAGKVPLLLSHYRRDPDLQNAFEDFDAHPKYTFSYGVHVPDTGDSKSARETREGGTVRGYYSFMDPDGKLRTVRYMADDKQGFRATVERTEQ